MIELDEFLEHYGVKGMKWGVRRDRSSNRLVGPSKDAKKATRYLNKAKTSGVKSLTNQELKNLNIRLQLERSYSSLAPEKRSVIRKGQDFTRELLGVGRTANDVIAFANSPAGGVIKDALKKKK